MSEVAHESPSIDAVAAADKCNGNGSVKKKKTLRPKSLKRSVKKLFSGESKKSKKNKTKDGETISDNSGYRIATAEAQDKTSTTTSIDDDKKSVASTVPSLVSTDDSMGNTPNKDEEEVEASFRIVLLLLDPETRRFELFNLDFESSQISVSEVLEQSSGSITSGSLEKVTYSGLMGSDGVHRSGAVLLSSFCIGNDVLVGIPDNASGDKIVQLAMPILLEKDIVQMISDAGADTTPWKKNISTSKSISTPVQQETKQIELVDCKEQWVKPISKSSIGQPAVENKTGGSRHVLIITMEILLGLLLLYQYFMNAGNAAPLTTGGNPLVPALAYKNQNSGQTYSCIRTCIDNLFVLGEDTTTAEGV